MTHHKIIIGHCLEVLREMPSESVNMIMTSPPYWGLRNYGGEEVTTIWGGDPNCEHEWGDRIPPRGHKSGKHGPSSTIGAKIGQDAARRGIGSSFCSKCGAWRGQLGLEPTWQMYVEHLVEISRELKRTLRKDGSYYLNLGDTYAGSGCGSHDYRDDTSTGILRKRRREIYQKSFVPQQKQRDGITIPKQKLLMPHRVAMALQKDGWICRNDITWYKRNSMPSSVKDRLTCKTEQIFHFVKSKPKTHWLLDVKCSESSEWKWLAALIDGEGSIGIHRDKREINHDVFSVTLSIGNTCKELLEKCVEIAGFGDVKSSKSGTNKPFYVWRINNRQASTVIAEVYPFLIAKREEAKVALALQETNKYRGNNKGENRGPKPISEKEWKRKYELFNLIKRVRNGESSNLSMPNVSRYGGCERYWYDLDAIREPHKTGTPQANRDIKRMMAGRTQYDGKWAEGKDTQAAFVAGHPLGKNPGDVVLTKHDMAVRRFPTVNRQGGVGYTDPLHVKPYHAKGKNPGDFWEINTRPYPDAHFATYPERLLIKPILSSCPPNGVVLDPCLGRGTTTKVARDNGRNSIGIEIQPSYLPIIKKYLEIDQQQQRLGVTYEIMELDDHI